MAEIGLTTPIPDFSAVLHVPVDVEKFPEMGIMLVGFVHIRDAKAVTSSDLSELQVKFDDKLEVIQGRNGSLIVQFDHEIDAVELRKWFADRDFEVSEQPSNAEHIENFARRYLHCSLAHVLPGGSLN